jgi:lysyl-tRNA synthetase class I
MVTKAELESALAALQTNTDRRLAETQEMLVQIVIQQVAHHTASARESLFQQLFDKFAHLDRGPDLVLIIPLIPHVP